MVEDPEKNTGEQPPVDDAVRDDAVRADAVQENAVEDGGARDYEVAGDGPRERAAATEIKPPGAGRRISYALFSRETRGGRFMRGLLRWLFIILLLAGIGAFIVYYFFYQPLEQSSAQLSARATESAVDLQRAQQELDDAQAGLTAAQESEQAAQEDLGVEQARVQILRSVAFLRKAQIEAVADGPAAESLTAAQRTLEQSYTRLNRIDRNASENLRALLTLARNGLERDPAVAVEDLERLIAELERLEGELESP